VCLHRNLFIAHPAKLTAFNPLLGALSNEVIRTTVRVRIAPALQSSIGK
jgi:hypothetical protein